ncbi:MAG TPA: response regulator transcription factor [Phycisphaerae bacterium]|nr:response regulator transcription factor [Phycisphaerae bacterium]HRY69255.1 response regulator transcription factor [Phycisphaerae bacterium]HSA26573.1 response regulator transcription factor [Phycisphaerae bacterium]
MVRILVIEDDAAIRQGIVDAVESEGYSTFEAADAVRGRDMALGVECDLVLLDLVLPRGDGLDILRDVRSARPTLPVIILTARGAEDDRIKGLKLGADDYVVKPFSVKELLARIEAVLRRSPERPVDIREVRLPGGVADLERRELRFQDGGRTELSERESELLRYLAMNPGRAVSREEILSHVWRLDPNGIETRTIDMHVARLREKLRDDGAQPRVLLTVRGKGYMFASEGG